MPPVLNPTGVGGVAAESPRGRILVSARETMRAVGRDVRRDTIVGMWGNRKEMVNGEWFFVFIFYLLSFIFYLLSFIFYLLLFARALVVHRSSCGYHTRWWGIYYPESCQYILYGELQCLVEWVWLMTGSLGNSSDHSGGPDHNYRWLSLLYRDNGGLSEYLHRR